MRFSQVRPELPQDLDERRTLPSFSLRGGSVVTYAVSSDRRSVEDLSNLVDLTIIPELLNVDGVGTGRASGRIGSRSEDIDNRRIREWDRWLQAYKITGHSN